MINEADLKCAAKIFKADLMVQERDLTLGAYVLEALNVKRDPHTRRNRESKYPIANFIKTHFDVTSADPGNNSVMRLQITLQDISGTSDGHNHEILAQEKTPRYAKYVCTVFPSRQY